MPKKTAPKNSAAARARKIKLLLFDVDGVLTDGKMFFLPQRDNSQENTQLSAQGSIEFKGFHAHDGVAISLPGSADFAPALSQNAIRKPSPFALAI